MENYEENLCTLRFAQTVASIKVDAKQAVHMNKDEMVKQLQAEIKKLKAAHKPGAGDPAEMEAMNNKIKAAEALEAKHAKSLADLQVAQKQADEKRHEMLEELGLAKWQVRLKFANDLAPVSYVKSPRFKTSHLHHSPNAHG